MAIIEWDSRIYSVGVELFDQHHKHLVDIINKLNTTITTNNNKKNIEKIIDELIDYTLFHFTAEEELMQRYEYPNSEIEEQKISHKKFIDNINGFKGKMEGATMLWTSSGMLDYLSDWLISHILVTDKKYSTFFKENNVR